MNQRRMAISLAILGCAFGLTGFACGLQPGGIDGQTQCKLYAADTPWLTRDMGISVLTPDKCPLYLPHGGKVQYFSAAIFGNSTYNSAGGTVLSEARIAVQNATGLNVNADLTRVWETSYFLGNPPRAEPSMYYSAGTAGIPLGSTWNYDFGYSQIVFNDGVVGLGTIGLTYSYTVATVLSGPGSVAQYTGYTLNSTLKNYTLPITRKWYRNGILLPGQTGASLTDQQNTPGTYTYRLDVVDAEGDPGTATMSVQVGQGGGGGGGGGGTNPCDGGGGGGTPPIPLRAPAFDSSAVTPAGPPPHQTACPTP